MGGVPVELVMDGSTPAMTRKGEPRRIFFQSNNTSIKENEKRSKWGREEQEILRGFTPRVFKKDLKLKIWGLRGRGLKRDRANQSYTKWIESGEGEG